MANLHLLAMTGPAAIDEGDRAQPRQTTTTDTAPISNRVLPAIIQARQTLAAETMKQIDFRHV
ncbi:hypothetical protein HGP16_06805 [Rhizobium sp. P40RR-XXII]|uniref:hypothetical protein n=1 Tax=unclassified Rhizobium TaxID=2613769 RepID=UPI001456452B|nr:MULTISPECIES: hypothetical protein [unclassified Rhizobium]NLR84826.1 hypothetical protein [Rhizobium sp. P28RR-XV]NLS16267.1 hypothetical protein [Rhizobium sp. P40RR-XXII]